MRAYAIVIFALDVQTCRKRPAKCVAFFEVFNERVQEQRRSREFHDDGCDLRTWFLSPGRRVAPPAERDGAENGLLTVFCAHTSASLCIQENADPDVLMDLADALKRLAPEDRHYRHSSEGPDDMPAHIKTLLTATSLSLPVRSGEASRWDWQEAYLIEHRAGGHKRRLEIDFVGSLKD